MVQHIEISDLDLRYENCRMKNGGSEKRLLGSILESGIQEPLEGVDIVESRILLNGFKRYRCAKKLGIGIVPYVCLGDDEAAGIIRLLRLSNSRSLTILEQAKLIDELKKSHGMSPLEIARQVRRSKGWVSMRTGLMGRMSGFVKDQIFAGRFPAYSYMYTLEQFIRMNYAGREEIDEFVNLVAGEKLSIRNIERLAHGYFKGPDDFREQIRKGNLGWVLERSGELPEAPDCNEPERAMLRDLEIVGKYMRKIMFRSNDPKFGSGVFYSQANLLAGGILSKIDIFTKILRRFYDQTGQTQGDLFAPPGRNEPEEDKPSAQCQP